MHYIRAMKIALLLSVLLLSACASSGRDVQRRHDTTRNDAPRNGNTRDLVDYARSLIGTPYRYGGDSPRSGFDCSGYVGHVFDRTLGISLPHNAKQISHHGKAISTADLREGDLVFFDTNNDTYSHVGIYLGNNHFVHAPSTGGKVRIEDMRDTYWPRHYNGARRITF
jgi:cell wall-associated NlpC family hydrolase